MKDARAITSKLDVKVLMLQRRVSAFRMDEK